MGKKVTATTTWREFCDARRNSSGFYDATGTVQEVLSGTFQPEDGEPAFKLEHPREGFYTFGNGGVNDVSFTAKGLDGARELAAAYAVYVYRVTKKGGSPTAFERPTKDGFE
jgi:hypothetical protein